MTSESVTDPRGYLRLAPALAQFTSDKGVAEALAEADGRKLHAALTRLRRGARSLPERKALDSLLAMRRLFFYSSSSPSLFTFNGFGVDFFGRSDPDPEDGTYIATHCITALFLPLFPLSQWLVRKGEGNSYQIFGQVPNSPTVRLWQQSVTGAMVAALLFTWVAVDRAGRSQVVHFTSGLDVPVAIEAKRTGPSEEAAPQQPLQFQLHPEQRTSPELAVGEYEVAVRTLDGSELQRERIQVPGRQDAVVFNVLGAAPLYQQWVRYSPNPSQDDKPAFTPLCGETFVIRDGIDYVFRDPPEQIKMSKGSSEATRTAVGIAEGGWQTCYSMLMSRGGEDKASALLRTLLLARPEMEEAPALMLMVGAQEPGGVVALAKALVERWPESLAAHRLYQHAYESQGQVEPLRQEYRARYEKNPGSAQWGYLLARVEAPARGRELLEGLVQQFPEDKHIRRALAWALFNEGQARESLPHMEAFERLEPKGQGQMQMLHVRALVVAGRGEEALALAEQGEEAEGEAALWNAFRRALVARRVRAEQKLATYTAQFEGEAKEDRERLVLFRTLLGLPVEDAALEKLETKGLREAVLLTRVVLREPDKAMEEARKSSDEALEQLHSPLAALLGLESLRRGDKELEDRLFKVHPELAAYRSVLEAYALHGEATELAGVDLEYQAAAHAVRAQTHPPKSPERKALLQRAREADVLQGPLTLALAQWQ